MEPTDRGQFLIEAMRKRLGTYAKDRALGITAMVAPEIQASAHDHNLVIIANTDDVDADEEVLVPSGAINDSYFFRNKAMFTDHETDFGRFVAKMRVCTPFPSVADHRQWRLRCQVLSGIGNPDADFIWAVASDPSLGIGVSVGYAPLDEGVPTPDERKRYPGCKWIIRTWDWLETSFTPAPCNVSCQTLGVVARDEVMAGKRLAMAVKHRPSAGACRAWGLVTPKAKKIIHLTSGIRPAT